MHRGTGSIVRIEPTIYYVIISRDMTEKNEKCA